jgi:hypothetical protein
MNRCNAPLIQSSAKRKALAVFLTLPILLSAGLCGAQVNLRPFPPAAERGVMVVTYPPVIQINGKPDRLSPGSRIRATNNMLVLSGSIIGQSMVVNFVRDPMGLVHEVWVLTPEEAAIKLPTQQ